MESLRVVHRLVALRLLPLQVRVMVKKAINKDEMANLAKSQCSAIRMPMYIPQPIICQKNVFIGDQQLSDCKSTLPLQSNAFNSIFCENSSSVPSFNPSFSQFSKPNFMSLSIKNKKKNASYTSSYENSIEYTTLIQNFSSGVRLHELNSIATILSRLLSDVKEPSRDEKRSFPLLIDWFHRYWDLVSPILPCIQLRDENNQVIDGKREILEKSLQHNK